MFKRCTKCGLKKATEEFHTDKQKTDELASACKVCKRLQNIGWKKANPDAKRELNKRWAELNPDKVLASNRAWNKKNPEKLLAKNQRWMEKNRDKARHVVSQWKQRNSAHVQQLNARRYAAKMNAVPCWFERDAVALLYAKGAEFGWEVDHVVPLQSDLVCGLHCWANLQLLACEDNAAKGNRYWPDMP